MTRRRTMPRVRRPLATALGTALAVPLLAAAPAAASQGGAQGQVIVTALRFTVTVGGRTCAVDADLYRPAGVDKAHPAPAVLTTNGFGGSKSDGTTAATGKAFATAAMSPSPTRGSASASRAVSSRWTTRGSTAAPRPASSTS